MSASRPFVFQRHGAFALVLVLAFVALLVGVCLAFFSNSILQRQISNSSASQVKVNLLADGAVDMVICDLKSEIAAGSNDVTPPGSFTKVYEPKTSADMVPYRLTTWQGNDALNNLVKISGQTFHPNVTITDSGIDTTGTSADGRQISPDRWREPMFLPSTVNLPSTPKWIDFTRDGGHDSSAVIGRYAFAIYDEGGLLDLNVAGYPGTTSNWDSTMDPASKNAVAYADLMQIPGLEGQQDKINALVNWRNAASLSMPGYKKYVETNRAGFLHAANTGLAGTKSDQMFVGRQQMISFLVEKLGWNKDTLQYFTSFSRDLNQPSLAPKHSGAKALPPLKSRSQGGNDQLDSAPATTAYDKINPKFLQIQVQDGKTFTRNDGTFAKVGEPLVKQRFALSRLIWITYQGPSQGKTGDDITDLLTNLNVKQEWLDQGTSENIVNYFGLKWESSNNCWRYNQHLNSNGTIKTLDEVAAQNREPDFFEILKASITAGALGKSSTIYAAPAASAADYNNPEKYQYTKDSTVDFQVMQIGANIIDQSDVDGYPTRIRYGSDTQDNIEFRGVENLPYLYRIRTSVYRTVDPGVPITKPSAAVNNKSTLPPPANKGEFIVVQQPELWNPHDYDATNAATIDRSLGSPRPTNFELVAMSGKSNLGSSPTLEPIVITPVVTWNYNAALTYGPAAPSSALSEDQSKLTFKNGPLLFREPTLLIKKGIPQGSDLAPGPLSTIGSGNGALVKDSPPTTYLNAGGGSIEPGTTPGFYLGIRLGRSDLVWASGDKTYVANGVEIELNDGITYEVRCQSPTGSGMETYDEKYFRPSPYTARLSTGSISLYDGAPTSDRYRGIGIISNQVANVCVDPRTSRFGMIGNDLQGNWFQMTEFTPYSRNQEPEYINSRWISVSDNTLPTIRPDINAGWGYSLSGPTEDPSATWDDWKAAFPPVNSGAKGWWWGSNSQWSRYASFRVGLLSQNIKTLTDNKYNCNAFVPKGRYNWEEVPSSPRTYYSDCDGVVRRAAGGYAISGTAANTLIGLPMATSFPSATAPPPSSNRQRESRPVILNRPFRSVGELGYVFSDTPWKNLDFSTAESGFVPLLDAFCINDSDNESGLVAGKVSLNTRQKSVIKAILIQAYRNVYATTPAALQSLTDANATTLAEKLFKRTADPSSDVYLPLTNLSDIVGRWMGTATGIVDGSKPASYDGFANDLASVAVDDYQKYIARYRETAVRALTANGTTRTWNLMIDLIAQSGHYLPGKSGAASFAVEGERHYWVHLAIDRFTGKVLDKQVEFVEE